MVNIKIKLILFFAAKNGEALCSQQKQNLELTVAQIMNSLLQNSGLIEESRKNSGFLGSSAVKESARNAGDLGLISGLGRPLEEGIGNPL